nr:uncharacterized protein CTRU02_06792 [Colletotrichum truncatum]KAF6792175.1 hypothetical protein CTRU02_06792 [Colletotrichum truncatum]
MKAHSPQEEEQKGSGYLVIVSFRFCSVQYDIMASTATLASAAMAARAGSESGPGAAKPENGSKPTTPGGYGFG